jgi:hypothetical protein
MVNGCYLHLVLIAVLIAACIYYTAISCLIRKNILHIALNLFLYKLVDLLLNFYWTFANDKLISLTQAARTNCSHLIN